MSRTPPSTKDGAGQRQQKKKAAVRLGRVAASGSSRFDQEVGTDEAAAFPSRGGIFSAEDSPGLSLAGRAVLGDDDGVDDSVDSDGGSGGYLWSGLASRLAKALGGSGSGSGSA